MKFISPHARLVCLPTKSSMKLRISYPVVIREKTSYYLLIIAQKIKSFTISTLRSVIIIQIWNHLRENMLYRVLTFYCFAAWRQKDAGRYFRMVETILSEKNLHIADTPLIIPYINLSPVNCSLSFFGSISILFIKHRWCELSKSRLATL